MSTFYGNRLKNKAAQPDISNQQSLVQCYEFSELQAVLRSVYTEFSISQQSSSAGNKSIMQVTHLHKSDVLQVSLADKVLLNTLPGGMSHLSYIRVQEGQIRYTLDDYTCYCIGAGQVIILAPGTNVHAFTSSGCQWIEIRISQSDIKELLRTRFGYSDDAIQFHTVVPDTSNAKVQAGMDTIHSLLKYIEQFDELMRAPLALESLESALCMTLIFSFNHQGDNSPDVLGESVALKRVDLVEHYIRSHARDPLDIDLLLDVAQCSSASLYRAYKKYRNTTPMAYLQQVRLQKARQMLLQASGQATVSYVASQCGFSHLGRFSKAYKQAFNENPSKTLQRVRENG